MSIYHFTLLNRSMFWSKGVQFFLTYSVACLFQAPKFNKLVLGSSSTNIFKTLVPSLTDRGLCYSMNSKSLINTFNISNQRVKEFAEIFGKNVSQESPSMVEGSGHLQRSTFWLNVRDMTHVHHGFSKGSMTLAINNWNEYFSVRWGNKLMWFPITTKNSHHVNSYLGLKD